MVTFIPHSLLTLHNEKYNIQQAKGWTQVKMKAVLHNEAIKNVLEKIDSSQLDYIVIDQFAKREVYNHYALSDIPLPKKTKFETKRRIEVISHCSGKHNLSIRICYIYGSNIKKY